MYNPFFLEEIAPSGIARITLTRVDVHNAFNDALISELTSALQGLDEDPRVRMVILAAKGRSFSAGADLNWMKAMAGYAEKENLEDARGLAELMRTLNELSKPTLALVQGAAFGGGVGLVACCDIALASEEASFCLSEVRLGLIPAVISPYVIAAIGQRAARRYFLTAERFPASEAYRVGLVHEVVPAEDLETRGQRLAQVLLAGGPSAQKESKDLIFAVSNRAIDDDVVEETAVRIARLRKSPEGREGVNAFLEKRKPDWAQD
ncbi:enoyl-CoA hydratase/isomerase family protein [Pelagibius sp. Alg239-R121]|uniref:enoyl-CoA hydratase/isomerase family protein n=1 Tax=Pelagibius sp. Alg239-R121 TaxID=2993448 RepID=UPI0024A61CD8|nr:enoyl-CoA hydratase/isomerase family protein [Pelagibius sp. Alg239-R121]